MSIEPVAGQTSVPLDASQAGGAEVQVGSLNQIQVSTIADLQKKAPEVWKAIMQGLATQFIGQQQRYLERLKETIRKSRDK